MSKLRINSGITVDYTEDGWGEFKKWLDGTYGKLQFVWVDEGLAYSVAALDGDVCRTFSINKADAADFEANYKVLAPRQVKYPASADGTLRASKQDLALGRIPFLRTDAGTELMNVNGLPAGAVEIVWNGAGDPGGDWAVTGDGSQTTQSAHSGTYGWDSGARSANDYTNFDKGSMIDVAGTYSTLSFWLQVKNFPGNGSLQVQWRNNVGAVVGSTLLVPNYVSNMDLNVWQKVTIPVADFALTGSVQSLRVVYKTGNGQQHWLDDFELQAAGGGGPFTFRVQSPVGFVYHVERLVLVVSAPNTGWSSTAFGNITAGLQNGLLVKYHNIGPSPQTFWTFNAKTNAELFGHYEAWNSVVFNNGEQLIAFSLNPELSSVILVDDDDVLDVVVRDNLSGLTSARCFLHIGKEIIPA